MSTLSLSLSSAEKRVLTAIAEGTLGRVAQATLQSLISKGLIQRAPAGASGPWMLTDAAVLSVGPRRG